MAKILTLDIETSPNLAYCWGIWDQQIQLNQIEKTSEMLCWAARWLGEKSIMFESTFHGSKKRMLENLHSLLDEADAVIHYNGKTFDIPIVNKEFLLNKMGPPSPFQQIDLIDTARRVFKFQSNRLSFICKEVGIGEKKEHEGFEMWRKCLEKNATAWNDMRSYNKHDVVLTEKLYETFLPWIKTHPNVALINGVKDGCTKCASTKRRSLGKAVTQKYTWRRWLCLSCGNSYRGERL